jgi:diadenosine tetraphosphate (Ap4A) HIT family hydrolase
MSRFEKPVVRVESAISRPGGGDEYAAHLKTIADSGICPFCPERFAHEHKRPIITETDSWILTENMYPAKNAEQHLLAIHKAHIEHLDQLTDHAWVDLRRIMIGEAAVRYMPGGTVLMRWGDSQVNGSSVAHLHAHLVSGTGTDDLPVLTRIG